MTLKKYYLLFISVLFIAKVNAQFVGYYNLHDGGVDMPHSSLFVLSNNEFLLFYYGGYKSGKWKEVDKNKITLTETKSNASPISVYGNFNPNQTEININVEALAEWPAFIHFSKDTFQKKEFQPIFNDGANCLAFDKYYIKKKAGEFDWVSITQPTDPRFGKELAFLYPYKAWSYTFPLDKKYNNYVVVHNDEAGSGNIDLTLTKKNNIYTIDYRKVLEREDLNDGMLKKISAAKQIIDNENSGRKLGNLVSCVAINQAIIYKPVVKPFFIATCENDDDKKTIGDENERPKALAYLETADGFYTVENFKESDYDVKKYKLGLKPGVNKKDILAVNKIISDRGGYEIEITFTVSGAIKFKELTTNNIGKPMAIVVNNYIISTPTIYSVITNGKAIIGYGIWEKDIDSIIERLKE